MLIKRPVVMVGIGLGKIFLSFFMGASSRPLELLSIDSTIPLDWVCMSDLPSLPVMFAAFSGPP